MEQYALVVAATMLRIVMGSYMVSHSLRKLKVPGWSAEKFLLSAKTFPSLYAWFARPSNLKWVNPLNSWGGALIGVAFLVGVGIQPAAWAGALLMILYYLPQVNISETPYGLLIDDHVIYAAAFVLIALLPEAQIVGLEYLFWKWL